MNMREKILQAAVRVAEALPLYAVTRGKIAKRAKCAPSLVSWYLGTMDELRDAIVTRAIETNNAEIIAWAIAARHPRVRLVPPTLHRTAMKLLAAE